MKINFDTLTLSSELTTSSECNLTFAGDWAPVSGNTSKILIEQDKEYYSELSQYFENADLNCINFEMTIGETIHTKEKFGRQFIDTPEVLSSLESININLACLSNNHIMDNDIKGLESTIKALNNVNISTIGAGLNEEEIYKPFCITKGDSKIAIINVSDGELSSETYNNEVGAADLLSYKFINTIQEYKDLGYMIIVSIHAGIEFFPFPAPFIKKIYHNIIDQGADIIIGHHPHVVQGVEIYNQKPIFYSLGHFSIHRKDSREQEKIGMLLNIDVAENKLCKIQMVPFNIQREKLTSLNEKELSSFKKKFRILSETILKDDELNSYIKAYVENRNLILNYKKVISLFKQDEKDSRLLMNAMVSSINFRYLSSYLSKQQSFSKEHIAVLKEYKLIKKISLLNKLFLLQKNSFKLVYKFNKTIYAFLQKLKRLVK